VKQYERAKVDRYFEQYDAYHDAQSMQRELERREREDVAELNYSFSTRMHHNVQDDIR
jgi:hypothetical protein